MVIATTMSTTTTTFEQFAKENHHPFFNYKQMYRAYINCRKAKRNKSSALAFEVNLEENLLALVNELLGRRYRPATSICFYTEKPKRREIFAADFRDRVVHHLIYNHIAPRWERVFIHHSYACRPEKGTHRAVLNLQKMLRTVTNNSKRRAYYLKLDIRNFFMSIDRRVLFRVLMNKCSSPDMRWLLRVVVFHEPTQDYRLQDKYQLRHGLPPHKSLFNAAEHCGLAIGNLTSQFFANVYLNELDQFVKHRLKCRYYARYVDDMLMLSLSRQELQHYEAQVREFAAEKLSLQLNGGSRRDGLVAGGVDFVGFIVRPDYMLARRRTLGNLKQKIRKMQSQLVRQRGQNTFYKFDFALQQKYLATLNSYLGHLRYGRCYKALNRIWLSNPFLEMYFRFEGGKVTDRFRALRRGRLTLRRQVQLLHRLFLDEVCIIQVGCFFEIFGKKVIELSQALRLQPLSDWRGWSHACGFHQRLLGAMVVKLVSQRISVIVVRQTGKESAFAKERLPTLLIQPRRRTEPMINRKGV